MTASGPGSICLAAASIEAAVARGGGCNPRWSVVELTAGVLAGMAVVPGFGVALELLSQSTSELIPLSSCTCSGGCSGGKSCANNCGFADQQCCGGCPTGKACQSAFCL